MPDAVAITGDIIEVAAALAGFMLLFTGNALAGFGSFLGIEQEAIRDEFRKRAWLGCSGVSVCIVIAVVALFANLNGVSSLSILAAILLVPALACTALCASAIAQQIE